MVKFKSFVKKVPFYIAKVRITAALQYKSTYKNICKPLGEECTSLIRNVVSDLHLEIDEIQK